MATALDVMAETWETLDDSGFLIKPLDGKDMLRVSDVVTFDDKGRTLFSAESCIVILRHGLKGWKNFNDSKGNQVVFDSNQEKNLARIPLGLVRNLALMILGKSELGAEDAKN